LNYQDLGLQVTRRQLLPQPEGAADPQQQQHQLQLRTTLKHIVVLLLHYPEQLPDLLVQSLQRLELQQPCCGLRQPAHQPPGMRAAGAAASTAAAAAVAAAA
jgi:hypothetical protein